LERKTQKVLFYIFGLFQTGEQKIEDWKKHGEGGVTKIIHQNPWKRFFPSATTLGDLQPQTHPNESRSSVHALSNLQS